MPFDGMVLAAVRKELAEILTGCRIDKIYQPAREEVHLILNRPGKRYRLLLSADPGMARVHLTNRAGENPPSPPVFCMVLRKHLEGGRITGFSQPGYDRVLTISVDTRDDLGGSSSKQVICEIMGRHSNIILYDPDSGTILDGIKRYSHAVSRHREVLPGRPYVPAPAQEKINPLSLSEEEFFGLMLQNNLNSRVSDLVQRLFDGLSPLLAREIVWRAGLEPGTALDTCGEFDLTSVYLVLKDIYSRAEKGQFEPTLVYDGGVPRDFSAFALTHFKDSRQAAGSMNEIADSYFTHRALAGRVDSLRQSILSHIKKETARLSKKLSAQTADLESAAGAEDLKLYGELVKANIHRLKKGDTAVYLENFFAEGCPPVKIDLDPRLTPAENAQHFFRQYAKAKKILENAALHAQNTGEELDYLAGVESSAEMASTLEELEQIRSELTDQGYLKPAGPRPVKQKEPQPPRPAAYVSSDGMTVFVGKNNRQNDYLTMKMARQEDIWLHTRQTPGAHVVIRTGGREVPPSTLEEAAKLAALFSRARHSSKVPVDYTLRKFVSKPRGAKPGFVIYTGQKTIFIDPDRSLPERLAPKQGASQQP
ncbi:MAG: Rqc2 family fibronectin-binding protein [Bacillota bacterium]